MTNPQTEKTAMDMCGCKAVDQGVNMCKKHQDELNEYYREERQKVEQLEKRVKELEHQNIELGLSIYNQQDLQKRLADAHEVLKQFIDPKHKTRQGITTLCVYCGFTWPCPNEEARREVEGK